MSSTTGLLAYCRQGFEPELAAELTERAALAGFAGYARAQRNDGHVVFVSEEAQALDRALPWRELIFARQKLRLLAELRGIDPKDRITPLLAALAGAGRYGDLWVEHPDSDSAKPLADTRKSNAIKPRSIGFCLASPCSGWRVRFRCHRPAVPMSMLTPPTAPSSLGRLGSS